MCAGGSFRHFLWQVCKELQSSALSLLLPCPSAAANRNKVIFSFQLPDMFPLFFFSRYLFYQKIRKYLTLVRLLLPELFSPTWWKLLGKGIIWFIVVFVPSSGEVHPHSLPYQLCRGTVAALFWPATRHSHTCRCATSTGPTGLLLEGACWWASWPRAGPTRSWCAHLQLCQEIWKRKSVFVNISSLHRCSQHDSSDLKMTFSVPCWRWLTRQSWRPSVLKSPPSTIQEKAQTPRAVPAAPLPTSPWLVKKWSFVREGATSLSGTPDGSCSCLRSLCYLA